MDEKKTGAYTDLAEESRVAGEMLERSLLQAVSSVENELTRVMRAGEMDLERLAQRIASTLAELAIDGAMRSSQSTGGDAATSLNGLATAIARAARRGARFT